MPIKVDQRKHVEQFSIVDEVTDSTMVMIYPEPIKSKPYSKQPIHVFLTREYNKAKKGRSNVAKCIVSVINAILNHDKTLLGLSRNRLSEIVNNDPNWDDGKRPTVTTNNYPAILAKLQNGILVKIFDGKKGGNRTASVYKLVHKGLLGLMDLDLSLENKWINDAKAFHESEAIRKVEKKCVTKKETVSDTMSMDGSKQDCESKLYYEENDEVIIEVIVINDGPYKGQFRAVKQSGRAYVYERNRVFSLGANGVRIYVDAENRKC